MNDLKKIKVTLCKDEGQGSCTRHVEKGKWNRMWMCFLYQIEGFDGYYCWNCVKEILAEQNAEIIIEKERKKYKNRIEIE